jgi:hypothetical protein
MGNLVHCRITDLQDQNPGDCQALCGAVPFANCSALPQPGSAKLGGDVSAGSARSMTGRFDSSTRLVSDRLRAAGLDPNTPPGTLQMRPLVYAMSVRQVEKLGVDIKYNKRVVD